ncbi:tetratricopeptide repeat protein [Naasia sp. SYSU D00948]|uniref:tetratricopeptide repeat protein n=1 Tax=Naasia sp. SYSU D00948 TaxID=2817379 RepID=UPI001B3092E6|nr:tetratricopeptide repeat protein [Naasia sp. SYSU D00948]
MADWAGAFLGVGVSSYASAELPELPRAVADVEAVAEALPEEFARVVLRNPDRLSVGTELEHLADLVSAAGARALVVMWSGHAYPSRVGGLRLLTSDSRNLVLGGVSAAEVMGAAALSGAEQVLLLLDASYSGEAVDATLAGAELLRNRLPEASQTWFGVLTSCSPSEVARDGLFGQVVLRLLRQGPTDAQLKLRWSRHNRWLRGDDFCDAVLKEWPSNVQSPSFQGWGSAGFLLPNPLWLPGAPVSVVEHLLLAARGGATVNEASAFTGRVAEVDTVVSWVRAGEPGIQVVTGSDGTGKSAILGRVVSLADPGERARLIEQSGPELGHADPGVGSVHAHVYARGLTADRMAELVGEQLTAAGVLRPVVGARNALLLVRELQQRATSGRGWPLPVLVVDGLDEASGEASTIVHQLLARLAHYATVIVATRDVLFPEGPSLVARLTPEGPGVDLDDPAVAARGLVDLREYVIRRLEGVVALMDPAAVAERLVESLQGEQPFLLARIVTAQLRARPLDTTAAGWERELAGSVEQAFNADLADVRAPTHRPLPEGADAAELARALLAALPWAYGAGFPDDEWITVAAARAPDLGLRREDLTWVLEQAGRYVVQDGEGGQAVYRLLHQSLAELLRPRHNATVQQPFDPRASLVAQALLDRYRHLIETGVDPENAGYLRRWVWRHVAEAGQLLLEDMRRLVEHAPQLRPDVAIADLKVAGVLASQGPDQDAVTLTLEAVDLYRELAATNPAYQPDLAAALTNLGVRLSEVGRYADALGPSQEAIDLYRELAATNPAYQPDLASALNNLGIELSQVGRRTDALTITQQAVDLYRELAATNPAYQPDLASALNNLGVRLSEVGRYADAFAPSQEATDLYRKLAATNPAYQPHHARALNNLGIQLSQVGRRTDALAVAQQAADLYRDLAATNPAYQPHLASALTNLGIRLSEVGRSADALAPTLEAADLLRELAATNPAYQPHLASALNNLGARLSQVGRIDDALAVTQEAAGLYRRLAATNPAFRPDLASALTNLGIQLSEVGWPTEARLATEEAVKLYRELAATNPAFHPDLASALNNLGIQLSEVGRPTEAGAATEEAVALYRELAVTNPAFQPNLASALNNLASRLSEVGRSADALAAMKEAVELYPDVAANNPALLLGLAAAFNKLQSLGSEAQDRLEASVLWETALSRLDQHSRAVLLLARSRDAGAGDPAGIESTRRGLSLVDGERELTAALRDEARRHFRADPTSFNQLVSEHPPAWLALSEEQLELARGWLATENYQHERDYLLAHPELLHAQFDAAIDEALLTVPEDEAERYRAIRAEARNKGVDEAYRPLLTAVLAAQFIRSDPEQQRTLLTENRHELLSDDIAAFLTTLASPAGAPGWSRGEGVGRTSDTERAWARQVLRAHNLLTLARAGLDGPVLEAMEDPDRFAAIFSEIAASQENFLLPAASLASEVAQANGDSTLAAESLFHEAIGYALTGEPNVAMQTIEFARQAAGDTSPATWMTRLLQLATAHPAELLPLALALLQSPNRRVEVPPMQRATPTPGPSAPRSDSFSKP